MNGLQNFHFAVIEYLYRGRRALALSFCSRLLLVVHHIYAMRPGKYQIRLKSQNKGHFAVQGHSRSPILVPIESSYTTSYQDDSSIGKYCALSLEFMNLLGIYTVGVARSLCRCLLLDSNRKLSIVMAFVNNFYAMRPENYQIW